MSVYKGWQMVLNSFGNDMEASLTVYNMCEFLDRVEARGIIKGTVATCREFHMTEEEILSKICIQFQLDEKEAAGYL